MFPSLMGEGQTTLLGYHANLSPDFPINGHFHYDSLPLLQFAHRVSSPNVSLPNRWFHNSLLKNIGIVTNVGRPCMLPSLMGEGQTTLLGYHVNSSTDFLTYGRFNYDGLPTTTVCPLCQFAKCEFA